MIGVHINRKETDAPEAPVYQYFLHNPRSGELLDLPERLVESMKRPKTYVHGPYIDRLTGGRHQNLGIAKRITEATEAKSSGYVVHIYAEPIGQLIHALGRVFHYAKKSCVLYLEPHVVSAVKRDELMRQGLSQGRYADPETMRRLVEMIKKQSWRARVGICIDTAHAWACGYNLSDPKVLKTYYSTTEGLQTFIHLNDSKQACGDDSRDIHDALCRNMWSDASLARALHMFKERHWDCIIEVTDGLRESYELACRLGHQPNTPASH
jgi:endonuclease IV